MEIKNKTFIVTGAASGLGAATAKMLAAEGGNVVLADVNQEQGQQLAAELGAQTKFVLTDVTDETSAQATVAEAVRSFGSLHGLVNCAGIAPAEKIAGKQGAHGLASFSRVLQINLIGSFNMLRLATQAMLEHGDADSAERGVIINTASIAAYDGQIGQAAYAASKGGLVSMTLPVARELARHAIRVMTIAPGLMETPLMLGMPQEVQDSLTRTIPFPSQFGKPADFSGLVRHIIGNSYLNGEVIRLDGALRMGPR
ncbi:3-hydroxyacyl-CoA dehydrogenase [Herbaspirillum autotrophicum]|uniref:3-hydroxyacyl-CoA dehydrogenase n=1 Tax=Herbaspirillum autotrophicum TaxID=180195 RepID=UPI00067BC84E|nr:3-hydroxyacyl-CoA dehydrogenase [Herbaspirillum autotrophicum]